MTNDGWKKYISYAFYVSGKAEISFLRYNYALGKTTSLALQTITNRIRIWGFGSQKVKYMVKTFKALKVNFIRTFAKNGPDFAILKTC